MNPTAIALRAVCLPVLLHAGSCIPAQEPTDVDRPQGPTDLNVTASTDTPQVQENLPVTMAADATGGTPAYLFRWNQNVGPQDVEIANATLPDITVGPLATVGRYVFRVVVTDARGFTDTDFVAIEVTAALEVTLTTGEQEVFEGMGVTLTAEVTLGTPPFEYTWELVEGPVDLDLGGEASPTLETAPFATAGPYTFQVTVTDAASFDATAEVTIEVLDAVSTDVPELARAGVPLTLSVEPQTATAGLTYMWEVVEGMATIEDPASEQPTLTSSEDETITVRLTVTIPTEDGGEVTTTREFEIVSVVGSTPRVQIETGFGDIVLELDLDEAPLHVENFLAYVNDDFYDGLLFHRISCSNNNADECDPFVLQGGGFERIDGELIEKEPTREPVPAEPNNLTNGEPYTVALALTAGEAVSGRTQFFINLADNSFLDDQDFTVFARVVEGQDVVDEIVAVERTGSPIIPGEVSLPVEDVMILHVTRVIP